MLNLCAVLYQQVPFRKVQDRLSFDLEFQRRLLEATSLCGSRISGKYLETFLRGFFNTATEYDDSLMELFLCCAQRLETHNVLYFDIQSRLISVPSSQNMVEHGTTGNAVWEAAVALAEYMALDRSLVSGQRVLELGAGTGLCSLAAETSGALSVTATDLAFVLESATRRSQQSNSSSLILEDLDWRYPEAFDFARFDLAIAADVVFDPEIVPCLVDVILRLRLCGASVIVSQLVRNAATFQLFLDLLAARGLACSMAPAPQPSSLYYVNDKDLIKLVFIR